MASRTRVKVLERRPRVDSVDSSRDSTDNLPDKLTYGCLDVFVNILSILGFLADVGFDLYLVYLYSRENEWWWSILTAVFIAASSVTMTCFSLMWYYLDHQMNHEYLGETDRVNVSCWKWVLRVGFCLLQVSPVLRYIDSIYYGLKSKKATDRAEQIKYYKLMLYEDADSTLLRLLECFLESAPQLVFQLYIIFKQGTHAQWYLLTIQIAAILTSLFSLGWSLVAYQKALRYARDDKLNLSWWGCIFMFMWRVCTIAPRVIALGLFASYFRAWIWVPLVLHYILMLSWLFAAHKTVDFFVKPWADKLFKIVLAIVYIFCYFNILEGCTRYRYLLYYFLVYIENAILVSVWYVMSSTNREWYKQYSIAVILGMFWAGIAFMLLYYRLFHPLGRGKVPLCVKRYAENRRNFVVMAKVNNIGEPNGRHQN